MLRIPWTATSILSQLSISEDDRLLRRVQGNSLRFFGYIERRRGMEYTILTGKTSGRRIPGRPPTRFVDQLKEFTGLTVAQMLKSAHLREVLLFAFNWKKSATEVHRMLGEVYSDHALSKSQCYRWFKKFQSGDFELDNEPHGKPPQKFEDAELQALLDEAIPKCRRNSQNSSRCLKVLFLYV
ncbi:hypothetical protein LAZ67_18001736 [Cordylochernes scorpioides]|uniref:Mos1 transposase HTH domain-containing protein n=1 Tax=Cordylochernes scorpioides TaxID=51811 RepID=A0ABY6LJR8_9ARAC|nr:hypothetical protein LAZ67_18001736 [Cordylochernes scorpioides]